jgi:hypothetical protein
VAIGLCLQRCPIADRTFETRDILPDEAAFERLDYVRWLENWSGSRHMIFRSTRRRDGLLTGIAFHAPRGQEQDEADRERFEHLHPHIFRCFEIGGRLSTIMTQHDGLVAAVDALDHGVIILDDKDTLLWANARAQAISAAQDGLSIDGGRLSFPRRTEREAAAKLLQFYN